MIGTLSVSDLAPLDYRTALDSATSMLHKAIAPLVLCRVPQLQGEIQQRLPRRTTAGESTAALWVEPMADTWQTDLQEIVGALHGGGLLLVVLSRPLARLLPERQTWPAQALGLRPGGVKELGTKLHETSFLLTGEYGFHTIGSMILNLLGRRVAPWRPDWADRLEFAARLHYCVAGPFSSLATVSLLVAGKEHSG